MLLMLLANKANSNIQAGGEGNGAGGAGDSLHASKKRDNLTT